MINTFLSLLTGPERPALVSEIRRPLLCSGRLRSKDHQTKLAGLARTLDDPQGAVIGLTSFPSMITWEEPHWQLPQPTWMLPPNPRGQTMRKVVRDDPIYVLPDVRHC